MSTVTLFTSFLLCQFPEKFLLTTQKKIIFIDRFMRKTFLPSYEAILAIKLQRNTISSPYTYDVQFNVSAQFIFNFVRRQSDECVCGLWCIHICLMLVNIDTHADLYVHVCTYSVVKNCLDINIYPALKLIILPPNKRV